MALDIGPKTIAAYVAVVQKCKSAIWNGPMGVFEMPCYSKGTFAIAKAMGDGTEKNGLMSIIGGGDSASAAELSGEAPRMSHVSTGGGASLELLEGKTLPGVAILDNKVGDAAAAAPSDCRCGGGCDCGPRCNCGPKAFLRAPLVRHALTVLLIVLGVLVAGRVRRLLIKN